MPVKLKDFVQTAKNHVQEITCDQVEDCLAQGYRLLDVREAAEYLGGTIPMALHVPRGLLEPKCDPDFPGHEPQLSNPDQPWLVFCQAGGRGVLAAYTMQQMGFTDVINLAGGFAAWKAFGGDMECPPTEDGLMRCDHPWNPGFVSQD